MPNADPLKAAGQSDRMKLDDEIQLVDKFTANPWKCTAYKEINLTFKVMFCFDSNKKLEACS